MEIGKIAVAFAVSVAVMFVIAFLAEKLSKKKDNDKERILTTRKIVFIGMFSAISTLLMLIRVPVFFAPDFYKIDLSELPALICAFAYGPVAGVMTVFLKVILKTLMDGSSSAMVGELANFLVGCFFVLPASIIYCFKKTRVRALVSCVVGTLFMTVAGSFLNAYFLLPAYAKMFEMPMDALIGMGSALNPRITGLSTFVLMAVVPLNLLKGAIVSIITMIVYKKLSPIMKKH